VAVALAWPYAKLHLAPDRQPCQHHTTQFFTGWMPFLPPNEQHQSTEIFQTAKQMVKERQDITGSNCLKGLLGKVIVHKKGIKDSWREYVKKLMNGIIEYQFSKSTKPQ